MKKGVVKEYDPSKGFGFITGENKEDYFVHVSGLREHLKGQGLRAGQKVSFDGSPIISSTCFASIKLPCK